MKKPREQPAQQAGQTFRDFCNEQYASQAPVSLDELLRTAQKRGIAITWDALHDVADLKRGNAWITPSFITDLLAAYAAALHPKTALDPWAGIGSTLIRIVQECKIPAATGISPSVTDIYVARIMAGKAPIEWVLAEPTTVLNSLVQYDLIVSSPPWGLQSRTVTITEGNDTIEVRDSGTYTLVLESARHLAKDGVGLFLLPNGFFFQSTAGVRNALPRCGLHINAVVALPLGASSPFTAIPINIVIISRNPTADLFVGQLREAPFLRLVRLFSRGLKSVPGVRAQDARLHAQRHVHSQALHADDHTGHLPGVPMHAIGYYRGFRSRSHVANLSSGLRRAKRLLAFRSTSAFRGCRRRPPSHQPVCLRHQLVCR